MDQGAWHSKTVEETIGLLKTSGERGLSEDEAKRRFKEYGPNELKEEKGVSPLGIFISQFKSILVIVLILSAVVSGYIDVSIEHEAPMDMYLILAIVLLMTLLGSYQEYRAEKAVKALKAMVVPEAAVMRGGNVETILSRNLVPGDLIILDPGSRIPADSRIIEEIHMKTDEAPLTGESTPVSKFLGALPEEAPLAERKNMLFMGTHVVRGKGKAIVTSTGMKTEFGKIATMVQEVEEEQAPLKRKLEILGRELLLASVIGTVLASSFGIIFGRPVVEMFMIGVSLAVSCIPEALPAVLTITLALGARKLAQNNAVARKLASVETLGGVTVICSDKTGTLTKNEMTVRGIYANNRMFDVTGSGYEPKGKFSCVNNPSDSVDEHLNLLLTIGCLCNNAKLESSEKGWRIIGDPTEGALLTVAAKAGIWQEALQAKFPRIDELVFESERKQMTTIHRVNGEIVAYVKGAPEVMLEESTHIYVNGSVRVLTKRKKEQILSTVQTMASGALRVLAMAYRRLPETIKEYSPEIVERNLIFVGIAGMIDPPRPEVSEAVKTCEKAGIRSVMITGDHQLTAMAIAKEIGMVHSEESKVLTGLDLDKMSDEDLDKVVNDVVVYARVSPQHKLRIAQSLKRLGHVVAMTGDGVNDAPAIKTADIGIAMGIKGTDVTKEASDMILADDNFATIVRSVEMGRQIYHNIRKYIRLMVSANFDEIFEITACAILGWPMILIPIHILWVNLMTDGLPAVALSFDPAERDTMELPPRDPKERILSGMTLFVVVAAIIDWSSNFLGFSWIYLTTGDVARARTISFTVICLFEYFLTYNCRSETHSIWRLGWRGLTENRGLFYSVIVSIGFQLAIIYIPFFNVIFRTVPLSLYDWLFVLVGSASGLLVLPEIFMRPARYYAQKNKGDH